MNKLIMFAVGLLLLAPSCGSDDDDSTNGSGKSMVNTEAKKACTLINDIRKNPDAYSSQMGVDLSAVSQQPSPP